MARTREELFATFLFLFLKHLFLELSNLLIVANHHRLPRKSILRPARSVHELNHRLCRNQNSSSDLTSIASLRRRQVLFTHVDSFQFDAQVPCRFLRRPQRQPFSLPVDDQYILCYCHRDERGKSKTKLKRQRSVARSSGRQ